MKARRRRVSRLGFEAWIVILHVSSTCVFCCFFGVLISPFLSLYFSVCMYTYVSLYLALFLSFCVLLSVFPVICLRSTFVLSLCVVSLSLCFSLRGVRPFSFPSYVFLLYADICPLVWCKFTVFFLSFFLMMICVCFPPSSLVT